MVNIEIEETYEGIKLTATFEEEDWDTDALQFFCSQTDEEIEYIGNRVTKDREKVTLIKYKNKIYFEMTWERSSQKYIIVFHKFFGKVKDTEPLEEFAYYIDYCNPNIKEGLNLFYYFKENELPKAVRMQRHLGEQVAVLREIKNQ